MPLHDDNPAGRLYKILASLRDYAAQGTSVQDAWRYVLNVDNDIDLQVGLAAVGSLVLDISVRLQSLATEVDHERYMGYIPRWSRFIAMQEVAKGAAYDANHVISQDELDMLGSLSDILHRVDPDSAVSQDAIDSLLGKIQELINDIIAANDVNDDLRIFILRHLRDAAYALQFYSIYGPERLDEVFGSTVADTVRNEPKRSSKTDESWFARFLVIVRLLPTLVKTSDAVVQLVEHTQKVLESGSG